MGERMSENLKPILVGPEALGWKTASTRPSWVTPGPSQDSRPPHVDCELSLACHAGRKYADPLSGAQGL